MKKALNYLKFISIFIIIELMLTFITSLLNLLGVNSGITAVILLIGNIILFFVLSFINATKTPKRGFLEGLIVGATFILVMFFIKLILLSNSFKISTLIYYAILLISSILGGMFGINKKSDN